MPNPAFRKTWIRTWDLWIPSPPRYRIGCWGRWFVCFKTWFCAICFIPLLGIFLSIMHYILYSYLRLYYGIVLWYIISMHLEKMFGVSLFVRSHSRLAQCPCPYIGSYLYLIFLPYQFIEIFCLLSFNVTSFWLWISLSLVLLFARVPPDRGCIQMQMADCPGLGIDLWNLISLFWFLFFSQKAIAFTPVRFGFILNKRLWC